MKYLLSLYREENDWADVGPEDMRASMEPWNEFNRELVASGAFVAGDALQPSATATRVDIDGSGGRSVTDGPFAETKEQLGGYYLIECADLDQAIAWARKVPLTPPGSIKVRPVMDLSAFGYEDPGVRAGAAS